LEQGIATPAGPGDRITHARLAADGVIITASDGQPDYPPRRRWPDQDAPERTRLAHGQVRHQLVVTIEKREHEADARADDRRRATPS